MNISGEYRVEFVDRTKAKTRIRLVSADGRRMMNLDFPPKRIAKGATVSIPFFGGEDADGLRFGRETPKETGWAK